MKEENAEKRNEIRVQCHARMSRRKELQESENIPEKINGEKEAR